MPTNKAGNLALVPKKAIVFFLLSEAEYALGGNFL